MSSAILLAGLVAGNLAQSNWNIFQDDFFISDSRELAAIENGQALYAGENPFPTNNYHFYFCEFKLKDDVPAANATEEVYVVYDPLSKIAISTPASVGTVSQNDPMMPSSWYGKRYLHVVLTPNYRKVRVAVAENNVDSEHPSVSITPLSPSDFGVAFVRRTTVNGQTQSKLTAVDFHLTKKICDFDVSVDTRKDYGDPGLRDKPELQEDVDPNYSPNYVRFGTSEIFGGLFVGCVPLQSYERPSMDRSGLGRAQIRAAYNPAVDKTPLVVTPSLMQIGFATSFTRRVPITCAAPTDSTNFEKPEAEMTWGTRWSVSEAAAQYSDAQELHTEVVPLIKWQMTPQYDYISSFLSGSALCGDGSGEAARALRAVFMLKDEATEYATIKTGQSMGTWRYFASKEYLSTHATNPYLHDAMPRFWVLSINNSENFYSDN